MSNLEKWINAILQEDADKVSIGTVRTLQMIKQEFQSMQKQNIEKDKEIDEFKKQAEGWKAAFEILEYLIKIKDEKSPKDFRVLTNKIVKEIENNL